MQLLSESKRVTKTRVKNKIVTKYTKNIELVICGISHKHIETMIVSNELHNK